MSRTFGLTRRPLSKSTPCRRAHTQRIGVALLLFASALAPRPAAAGLLDDLWAGLRFLWGETSWEIDPNGLVTSLPTGEASALWAEEGWQIDPNGLVSPPPSGGASALWGEQGVLIDPSGLPAPAPLRWEEPDRY